MVKHIEVLPVFEPGLLTFKDIPKFQYQRTLTEELADRVTTGEAIRMLDFMLTIRAFEEMVISMKDGGYKPTPDFKFTGATHLSIGQEAVAVGSMAALRGTDLITSTHRGHGHGIAKTAYALLEMDEEHLAHFLGQPRDGRSRDLLLDKALQLHLVKTVAELLGKEEGYCRGRGGGMHIADFYTGHLGANAIVGGSLGIGAGAAMAVSKLGTDQVVLCIAGDGASNNGICHEAYNFACMGQFQNGTPVIFLVENNQYGMTGQQLGEVTNIDYLARRGAGYNHECMHAEVVNGMSVLAVWDAVGRARERCANGEGPVLLDTLTYRYMGHSLSDLRTTYRTRQEEDAWRAQDAISTYEALLVEAGVLTETQIEEHEAAAKEKIAKAAEIAAKGHDPDPATIYEGLYTDTHSNEIGEEWKTVEVLQPPKPFRRDAEGRIFYRHAVNEALAEEMMRDRRVILYGEDLADYGGAFQVTAGLIDVFGRERVFNTAISESAIVGSAAGAAMAGLRPVCEIMYIDFILMAMDQVGNQAAKARYMFGGKATVPMVIRTTIGGGKGYAGQHSQSLEAVVTMIPGLKVVAPSTASDAKGLLKSAIRDDNPVVFIEHQSLYLEKDVIPEGDHLVPLGVAAVRREGNDVTVITYSSMVPVSLAAAEKVAEQGISVEVIDLRTLLPLDIKTILASVQKTGRVVLVTQAPYTGCFPQHVAFEIQKRAFRDLKAPMNIVAAHDVPPPMAQSLEMENLPNPAKVAREIVKTMKGVEG